MRINIVNYFDSGDYSKVINTVCGTAKVMLELHGKAINIILVDNDKIQEMNLQYREKDYPTDVLTFNDGYQNNLGDIFISLDKCEEQRIEYMHSFNRELGFLVIHGLLHTLGYDHQNKKEEKVMVDLQNKVLEKAKLFR